MDERDPKQWAHRLALEWAHRLALEVARRTELVAGRSDADVAGGLATVFRSRGPQHFDLRDPRRRLEVLEKVWPKISPERQAAAAKAGGDLRERIVWTFEELGKKSEAAKFVAAIPAPAPPPPKRADRSPEIPGRPPGPWERRPSEAGPRLFQMPALTALPTELQPAIEQIAAVEKAGLYRIRDLALLAGQVWLIGEGHEEAEIESANRALPGALRPTRVEARRLFRFDPANGQVERVAAAQSFTPVSLLAHDGLLWLALGREGVATFDPAPGALRRFGAADGLDVQSAYRFAVVGGRVFVTANMNDLFAWNPADKRWSAFATNAAASSGPRLGAESRHISGRGNQLLLAEGPIALGDVRSSVWTRPEARRAGQNPPVGAMTADARDFWLGGSTGLFSLDPETGEIRSQFAPRAAFVGRDFRTLSETITTFPDRRAPRREAHPQNSKPDAVRISSRLPGPVQALASDGDFLWLAARAADSMWRSHVMLLHKPSGQWVGHIRTSLVTSLAVDERHLWIGCLLSYGGGAKCLLRLEKQALYGIPQDRWMSDAVSEAESLEAFARLTPREQALWQFITGDPAAAVALLEKITPQTAEILFLQGLCHDTRGLQQPDKAREFFRRVISEHPADPLAEEARKQLAQLPGEPAR